MNGSFYYERSRSRSSLIYIDISHLNLYSTTVIQFFASTIDFTFINLPIQLDDYLPIQINISMILEINSKGSYIM